MTAGMKGSWRPHPEVDLGSINADLVRGVPTVDVALYYPDNLDPSHRSQVTEGLMVEGFVRSKEVFGAVGVQLRLVRFHTGPLDPRLFAVRASGRGRDLPSGRFANMYVEAERRPAEASDEVIEAFETMVGPDMEDADRVVHVAALQAVFMEWYEPVAEARIYQPQLIETGGLSFPGYMHGDTLPRRIRGAITVTNLTRTETSWKTIAHELGHKLINVSHEHRDTSPQHEVQEDGGLMFYGKGTEILAGPEGRYHHERLHRSPHIYVEREDGTRDHNPDYADRGFYYDPIYEGVSVEF